MNAYPISLNLKGRSVVVIGGGRVACRKVLRLLEAKATVTVVSPSLHETIQRLVEQSKISWVEDTFKAPYLQGAQLIFSATNNKEVNQLVYQSKESNQWVNIADAPELSDFHIPSSFSRGKLSITVSTSGASPILARKIKNELEKVYDEQYEPFLDFLFLARKKIKEQITDEMKRKKILTNLVMLDNMNISVLMAYLEQENIQVYERE